MKHVTDTTSAIRERFEWTQRLAQRLADDGDDLAQDAWLAAVKTGGPRAHKERAWFRAVVRRRKVSRWRARQSALRRERMATTDAEPLTPEQVLHRRRVQYEIARQVAGLTPPLREVVVLRFEEGLSAAEIARRLELPASTVKSRLGRALEELRSQLDAQSGGDRSSWQLAFGPLFGTRGPRPRDAAPSGAQCSAKFAAALSVAAAGGVLGAALLAGPGAADARRTSVTFPGKAVGPMRRSATKAPVNLTSTLRSDVTTGCQVTGAVLAAGNTPVSGASVWSSVQGSQLTQTNAQGRFAVDGMPGQDTLLVVTSVAYLPATQVVGGCSAQDIALRTGGTLVRGVVEDRGGGPIVGAMVVATGLDTAGVPGRDPGTVFLPTATDRDGRFQLRMPNGRYGIRASHFAYVESTRLLEVDDTISAIELALDPAGVLRGRVVEEATGRPVPNARLEAIAPETPWQPVAARSDQAGRFELARLPSGSHHIIARAAGLATPRAQVIELGEGEDREALVSMQPALDLEARVLDATSRDPIEGARVYWARLGDGHVATSKPGGVDGISSVFGLVPGRYLVGAAAVGYAPSGRDRSIEISSSNADQVIEIHLERQP